MRGVSALFVGVVVLGLFGGANYYIVARLHSWLALFLPALAAHGFVGIYALAMVMFLLGFVRTGSPTLLALRRVASQIGGYWLGCFLFLLMGFLAGDGILFIGQATGLIPTPTPSSVLVVEGLIVVVASGVLVGYGAHHARQITGVSYDVPLTGKGLPREFTIALVSDLHLGTTNNERGLGHIVDLINSMEPDLVCIAGDIFNDDFSAIRSPEQASQQLRRLNPPHGVYACLGNHDGGKTIESMVDFLAASAITLLNDEHVVIDDSLVLIGRLDPSPIGGFGPRIRADLSQTLANVDTSLPVVVMDHTPPTRLEIDPAIDLILCGHTHQGQVFPGNLIVKAVFPVSHGYRPANAGHPHIIVTSGTGTWGMPLRIGTSAEVVNIRLRST